MEYPLSKLFLSILILTIITVKWDRRIKMTNRAANKLLLFLLIFSMVFTFLGNFKYFRILYFIGIAIIGYALFRTLSKNHEKRREELFWYLRWSEKPKAELKLLGNKIRDAKTHKYFKCKQVLSLH